MIFQTTDTRIIPVLNDNKIKFTQSLDTLFFEIEVEPDGSKECPVDAVASNFYELTSQDKGYIDFFQDFKY